MKRPPRSWMSEGGRSFRNLLSDSKLTIKDVGCVPVAQLDRVSASEAEGRTFESYRGRHTKKDQAREGLVFFSMHS